MIRIGIVGDIGSGKSYVAKQFGYPVFNADAEVARLYRKSRKCYNRLKKVLPAYIVSFPIKKNEISKAIIADKWNLKKIVKIVHPEVRFSMNNFIKKNKSKKFVILDIPLLIENNINKKNDVLIFVDAKKKEIKKRLKKRSNFEITYAAIVRIDENVKNEKEMEQIVLSDVPNEIYPRLEDLFISLVN